MTHEKENKMQPKANSILKCICVYWESDSGKVIVSRKKLGKT